MLSEKDLEQLKTQLKTKITGAINDAWDCGDEDADGNYSPGSLSEGKAEDIIDEVFSEFLKNSQTAA